MPSVGMRSRTRVFGARVLRSGRRLWSEERHSGGDDGGGGGFDEDDGEVQLKGNGWKPNIPAKHHHHQKEEEEVTVMDIDATDEEEPQLLRDLVHRRSLSSNVDKMLGLVYQRKRKRSNSDEISKYQKKYGNQYSRKKWRKADRSWVVSFITSYSSSRSSSWFSCVLSLILKYMKKGKPRLSKLSTLLFSEPAARVFSSHGIGCFKDLISLKNRGSCILFGSIMLTVNFLAIPSCFMSMQWSLLLKNAWFPYANVDNGRMTTVVEAYVSVALETVVEPSLPNITAKHHHQECEVLNLKDDISRADNIWHPSIRGSKLAGRTAQLRTTISSRTIRKKRSTVKSRRVKKAPGRNNGGSLLSAFVSSKLDPEASGYRLRNPPKKPAPGTRVLKSALQELKKDISSSSCSANILVVETDHCFRIPSAIVKMEFSPTKKWFLAVKKDGIMFHSLTVRDVMRPCSNNRVTRDVIWRDENNTWKLEFPDKKEWAVFKELYKECSNRNLQAPSSDDVPIPRIKEVSDYYPEDSGVTFVRPSSYISVKDDELSRALMNRTGIYDMDSADEEWLRNFNNMSSAANEQWDNVKEETFELIIDAFEKASHCSPDDFSNEAAAVSLCSNLERKEVIEAVYSYWMKRRKQKRAPLLRVFQFYQPSKRAQLFSKPILRKKRTANRRGIRCGKGKPQQNLIQAATRPVNPEKSAKPALEEQKALLLKVEETKAAATKSELLAIEKRQRVQRLMENADLATYKATMAMRIADAARVAESAVAVASFFIR